MTVIDPAFHLAPGPTRLVVLSEAQLHALRSLVLDYVTKPGSIEEFHRVIEGDVTPTLGLLTLLDTACNDVGIAARDVPAAWAYAVGTRLLDPRALLQLAATQLAPTVARAALAEVHPWPS